jgi:hypothetical protein
MLRSISDLHFTDKSQPRVSQFACGIAPSQVRDALLECADMSALLSGDMSPHSKNLFRQAQKDLCASNVLLEHSDILLSSPLMRGSSPPRWIQIILISARLIAFGG